MKTLLYFLVICAAACPTIFSSAALADSPEEEAALASSIKRLGGAVKFDEEASDRPIVEVTLWGNEINNQSLAQLVPKLKRLPKLQKLLVFSPEVTDEGLLPLAEMANLKGLKFNSNLTGAGLAHLEGLMGLESLEFICSSELTDEGLANLKRFPQLRRLSLVATPNITDATLVHVAGLTSLVELSLQNTAITEAGLAQLKVLGSLRTLRLSPRPQERFSEESLKELQLALPNCHIK